MARQRVKKTQTELHQYNKFIANSDFRPDSTVNKNYNNNLKGSNENAEDDIIFKNEKVVPKKIRYKVYDWCKNNISTVIIVPAVITLSLGAGNIILNVQKDTAVLCMQVEKIEDDLDKLDSTVFTKEEIEMKLNLLEMKIQNNILTDIKTLENEINILKEKISIIKTNTKEVGD